MVRSTHKHLYLLSKRKALIKKALWPNPAGFSIPWIMNPFSVDLFDALSQWSSGTMLEQVSRLRRPRHSVEWGQPTKQQRLWEMWQHEWGKMMAGCFYQFSLRMEWKDHKSQNYLLKLNWETNSTFEGIDARLNNGEDHFRFFNKFRK